MSSFDSRWRKSSFSNGGGCVEVRREADRIYVRDTKDRTGPTLQFTQWEWFAFIAAAKNSEFDVEEPLQH